MNPIAGIFRRSPSRASQPDSSFQRPFLPEYEQQVLRAMLCMTRQCWEDGIAAQALLEMNHADLLSLFVYDMVLRQSSDGRLCNVENTPAVTDSSFCVPAVYLAEALAETPDGENVPVIRQSTPGPHAQAAQKNISFFLQDAGRAKDGTLFHMIHTGQIWADSAAFLPYSLALTGHYEEAWTQMKGITDRLYDPQSGLYFHMWDEERHSFIRALPWGIGNGWILTGLLRTLAVWKGDDTVQKTMEQMFRDLLERMLALETPAHLFHDILNDPSTYEESETAAMVAYAIYRGIEQGLCDKDLRSCADAIRLALHKKTSPAGLVLDAASSPSFDRPGTAVECQAHVLMMEEAYRRCWQI